MLTQFDTILAINKQWRLGCLTKSWRVVVLEENVARIDAHIASPRSMPGALMPLLHAMQDELG